MLRRSQKNGASPTDFLGGLSPVERDELAEIHLALERIERGIYGSCEGCQSKIDEARLQAKPWERSCEGCEAEASTSDSVAESADAPAHLAH